MNADLGPIGTVVRNLQEGSIDVNAAKESARRHGAAGEVPPEQAAAMAAAALRLASEGDWRHGLPIGEISYEAAKAAHEANPGDRGYSEAWVSAATDLVEIIHHAAVEHGDVRLYLRTEEIGDEVVPGAAQLGLTEMQGLLSHRLGAFLLDAYTGNKSPTNYRAQLDAWVARARYGGDPALTWMSASRLGADGEAEAEQPASAWPEPLQALAEAEDRFREALRLVVPARRGQVLKALAQTLEWRGLLGGQVDREDLRSVAEEALRELPADDGQRLAVLGMLQRLGEQPAAEGDLLTRLEREWPRFLAESDQLTAWDAAGQGASLLAESDPERALAILGRRRELDAIWADEFQRSAHFQLELLLFSRAYAPEVTSIAWEDIEEARRRAEELAGSASDPGQAREAAAALLAVMQASTKLDREGWALDLIPALAKLDRSLWDRYEDAVAFTQASLLRGEGVNRMRQNDLDGAAAYYREAVNGFLAVGMPSPMVQSIEYLDDVVKAGGGELVETTAWLATSSLRLELAAPSAAPAAVQTLASHLLAVQLSTGTVAEVVSLLLQIAKGRRFAAMLAEGTCDFELDHYTTHMLEREREAEAALPPDSDVLRPAPFDAALGDDDLVTAWVDEYEAGPSETPADRVSNVQRAIERHLSARLVPERWPPVATLGEVKQRLDERTALLQLFEGPWTDGNLAIYQMLVTRDWDEVAVGMERTPYGIVGASWKGQSVTMPQSGFYVGALRRAIQADPGPFDLAPEAEAKLAGATEHYAQILENRRDRLQELGIERLVVAPHSSNRFVPIHLLGPPGDLLADRFAVSYIANIGQMTTKAPPASRRGDVGVFALSYADQPRLPRLDDSAAEAEAIAATCGTAAILDEDATESAFKDALESCRFVHLRAHGRLYIEAPSFHTVFLHPADGHDGRLRAYEVLPLDLAGLELVTLGACETALGRVDRSDNPRGLPAALLLAGAEAVVGTLWPVLAAASTEFFTSLYAALMEQRDSDVAAAFAQAQRRTRELFPQYRDWGAFYLLGGAAGAAA